jgi:hypothetical protein
MKMVFEADEFKEELQRLAHVTKIRNDERIQASERALQLFGPIREFLLRFNEALGEFGKIEVAGPHLVGKYQHATATITAPNGRVVSWEFVLSESSVSYQRTPFQMSEYSRLESQLKAMLSRSSRKSERLQGPRACRNRGHAQSIFCRTHRDL